MGIQIHSAAEYRLAVRLVQDGAIGKVNEVHTWSSKKWGDPDPTARPQRPRARRPRLGPVARRRGRTRPFIGDGYYHPGNWRKRLDFGTGTFGEFPQYAGKDLRTDRHRGKTRSG